ncbi:MAG: hypothetical protein BHV69_09960 [Bacteroidales bacterium 52_46]|nr:MAG: hypothetical protein BHV69_09960 [Bacteroidales bacterium 52_46]
MNDDQITALAREYAEFTDLSPVDKKNVSAICENFLKYALRRYCIVEKSRVTDLCRLTLEHEDSVDYGLIDGLTDIVCDIFSEQYHQVADGLDNPEIAKEVEE